MANLIIKSSADNLVLQGSDASPAITVGATGTTTFAENATLSGTANNLGTVATMTLPTASATAVYPVGHVVQTSSHFHDDNHTTISSSNNTWGDTVVAGSITPIYSDSSILIHTSFTVELNDASSEIGFGCRFKRTASGISDSTPLDVSGSDQASTNIHSQFYRNGFQYTQLIDTHSFTWMDDNVSVADTAVTYTLQCAGYSLGSACNVGGPYGAEWHIFFQEIKR